MPHDHNGNPLKVGDRVLLPGKVTAIQPSEEYCNCTIEPDFQMPPYKDSEVKGQISSINTKQLILCPVPLEGESSALELGAEVRRSGQDAGPY